MSPSRICRLVFAAGWLIAVHVLVAQSGSSNDESSVVSIGAAQHTEVTVTLGYGGPIMTLVPQQPDPPVTVRPGSTLRIVTGVEGPITSVQWFKSSIALPGNGSAIEIPNAAPSDSGLYHAVVTRNGETIHTKSATVRVIVPGYQQFLDLSSRTIITTDNPILIGGLVIASGGSTGGRKPVLIRAIGPSLTTVGVPRPLAAPKLKIYTADGTDWDELPRTQDVPFYPLTPQQISAIVGAFPLLPNSKDIVRAEVMPPGVYTAHVSSADGGNGDVLLEFYEIPDDVLRAPWSFGTTPQLPQPPPPALISN